MWNITTLKNNTQHTTEALYVAKKKTLRDVTGKLIESSSLPTVKKACVK